MIHFTENIQQDGLRQMKRISKRLVAQRYSVTPRTIDRWAAEGILPEPIKIKNRRYWDLREIEQAEIERMAAQQQPASTDAA